MHPFLSRIIRGKQLVYKDGYLNLMGTPAFIFSLNVLTTMQKMLEEEYGQKGLSIMYNFLGFQTGMAVQMTKNRFGYDKEGAMRVHMGQAEMIGAGKIEFIRMNLKRNHFILRGRSNFSKEYLNSFGIQKEPVCWMYKGAIANLININLDRKDIICIETSCIAQGKQYCEFIAKPKKDFNLKDPKIKRQLPLKFKLDINKIIGKSGLGIPKREN